MCMFTGSVRDVSRTVIFARPTDDGRQVLVYSMALTASTDVAMVLPLPVPPGSAEQAVRFIDLSAYPEFFDDMNQAFYRESFGAASPLRVHEVGSFEASFVPTRHDFSRLDARFRLPDDVWQALPGYDDWGFAVFKLRPMARPMNVHPMAFDFPRRNPCELFFPTVHVHQGRFEPRATFHHLLFCQDVDRARLDRWNRSFQSEFPDHPFFWWTTSPWTLGDEIADRAPGIVRADLRCHRVHIEGSYPNVDVVV